MVVVSSRRVSRGRYKIRFTHYHRELLDSLKLIPGRVYERASKEWAVPGCSQLVEWWERVVPAAGAAREGDTPAARGGGSPNITRNPNGGWEVKTGYSPFFRDVMATAGEWNKKRRVWLCPDSQGLYLAGLCDAYGLTGDSHLAGLSRPEPAEVRPDGLKFVLRDYQAQGVGFICSNRRVLIADQPRLGKTAQALGACHHEGGVPVVVVCPPALRLNWAAEVSKTLPDETSVFVLDSRPPDGTPKPLPHDVVIVGYTGLSYLGDWLPENPRHVIFDESHYLKNPDAKRTKAAAEYATRAREGDGLVVALSGSPVINKPLELLSQLNVLDRRDDVAGSDGEFMWRYCGPRKIRAGHREVRVFDGASNIPELRQKLENGIMLRRVRTDIIDDMPPKTVQPVKVELEPGMRRLHDSCREAVGWRLTSAEQADIIEAASEHDLATQLARLALRSVVGSRKAAVISHAQAMERRQVMRDIARHEPGDTPDEQTRLRARNAVKVGGGLQRIAALRQLSAACKTPTAKRFIDDWLKGTETTGDKLVVFAHHRSVLDALADRYGCGAIHGGVTHRDRQNIVGGFQDPTSGDRLLVCGIDAASEGISLAAADDVLFVEQPWTPARLEQAEDRVYEVGKTRGLTVQYLLAEGTLDQMVDATVRRKQRTIDALVSADRSRVIRPRTATPEMAMF